MLFEIIPMNVSQKIVNNFFFCDTAISKKTFKKKMKIIYSTYSLPIFYFLLRQKK